MSMDLTPGGEAELAIIAALKEGLLEVYGSRGADPTEMQNLAEAITRGVLAGLEHIRDHADVIGVTAGVDTIAGGIE